MRTTKTYYGIQLNNLDQESSSTVLRTLFISKEEAESMLKGLLDALDQLEVDNVDGELVEFSIPIEEGSNNPNFLNRVDKITCEEE